MLRKSIFGEMAQSYRRYGRSSDNCIVEVGPRGLLRHTKKCYRREQLLGRRCRVGIDPVPGYAGLYQDGMAALREQEKKEGGT